MLYQHLESFIDFVIQQQSAARLARHRYLVVISGERTWAKALVEAASSKLEGNQLLSVSEDIGCFSFASTITKGNKIKHHLGQECDHLIWDGFSGLNPDGLGAASGLVKGGGLFFLLIPPIESLLSHPDSDYLRMCSAEEELSNCTTHFQQHLVNCIQSDPNVCLIEQHKDFYFESIRSKSTSSSALPTEDQREAIEGIKKVASGRAKRPLVITADRGRGKSAALGLASAELEKERNITIGITGPSEAACTTAIKHYRSSLEKPSNLKFYAPDELLNQQVDLDLLLVDEAASIPNTLLSRLLQKFRRIVFASTVHGYEGTGRGFAVRFRKTLNDITPQWKGFEMSEPIRWSKGDPLEEWVFNALCLDADAAKHVSEQSFQNAQFTWVDSSKLILNPVLLKQVFGLLVIAHYQTAPSDLRMILDHPNLSLGIIEYNSEVLAVVVVIEEGGIRDDKLTQGIIRGERKPRNHLVPQALSYANADPELMELTTLRVMRIATHPNIQRRGIGTKLLTEVEEFAREKKKDYMSSSFGFTPELMHFWNDNTYDLVRIGRHKDAASGSESIIVAKPLSNKTRKLLGRVKQSLTHYFEISIPNHFRTMDALNVWGILRNLEHHNIQTFNPLVIESLIEGHRGIEDSIVDVIALIKNYMHKVSSDETLSEAKKQALVVKILQGRSWNTLAARLSLTGKAEGMKLVREGISELYKAVSEINDA